MNWFGRKASETSPGGSVIQRHSAKDFMKARFGFSDESTRGFAEAREGVYRQLFGEPATVSHEVIPQIPHIDVYTHFRSVEGGCDNCVLVTGGMSDAQMRIPRGSDAPRRVELILYCTEPNPEYIETMRWLAHFPHNQKTWIGVGHTIPNGNPPGPFWGSRVLDTILLLPTIVQSDAALPERLKLAGEPVHFLWVVPLTAAECNLKLEKGLGSLLDLFEKRRHSHIFNPGRASYV